MAETKQYPGKQYFDAIPNISPTEQTVYYVTTMRLGFEDSGINPWSELGINIFRRTAEIYERKLKKKFEFSPVGCFLEAAFDVVSNGKIKIDTDHIKWPQNLFTPRKDRFPEPEKEANDTLPEGTQITLIEGFGYVDDAPVAYFAVKKGNLPKVALKVFYPGADVKKYKSKDYRAVMEKRYVFDNYDKALSRRVVSEPLPPIG